MNIKQRHFRLDILSRAMSCDGFHADEAVFPLPAAWGLKSSVLPGYYKGVIRAKDASEGGPACERCLDFDISMYDMI